MELSFAFWYMLPIAVIFSTVALGTGVEGATFFSPFFILALGLDPKVAIGAGLIIEVFGFSSGLYAYVRRRLIDYRMGGVLLAVSIPSALVGTYAAHYVPDDILKTILGVGLVVVAASFIRAPSNEVVAQIDASNRQSPERAERCRQTAEGETICYTVFNRTEGMLSGGIGGLFIGMVSTGLGELNGYLFLQRCRIPARVAIATSVFVVALTALTASVGHVTTLLHTGEAALHQLANVLAFTVPGVLIGGQIGPAVSERIPERTMELGMGLIFLTVSLVLLGEVAWG
jgi:hypothetical protein